MNSEIQQVIEFFFPISTRKIAQIQENRRNQVLSFHIRHRTLDLKICFHLFLIHILVIKLPIVSFLALHYLSLATSISFNKNFKGEFVSK